MNTQAPARPLLSTAEVAAMLGVTKVTVRRYVAAGKLPVIRLSTHAVKFRPDDVEALMVPAGAENA
jgi:excisionase family DNA binding protein